MSSQTYTLDLTVNRHTVVRAIQWLHAISDRELWPSTLRFSLTIGLDEALTNVVSHAFNTSRFLDDDDRTKGKSTPRIISLRCLIGPTHVQLEIIDNGRPYDPTQAVLQPPLFSIDQAQPGGHGLRLMRHYVSDISYARRDGHNYLTLRASKVIDSV